MAYNITLKIPAISCHHCIMTIVRETRDLPGVIRVEGSPQAKTATFMLEDESALTTVKRTLVEIGYPATD